MDFKKGQLQEQNIWWVIFLIRNNPYIKNHIVYKTTKSGKHLKLFTVLISFNRV